MTELEPDIGGCDMMLAWWKLPRQMPQAAGVAGDITINAVQDLCTDKINGAVISNPPYGERLSDDAGATKPMLRWDKSLHH